MDFLVVGKQLPHPWTVYGFSFPSSARDSPKAEAARGGGERGGGGWWVGVSLVAAYSSARPPLGTDGKNRDGVRNSSKVIWPANCGADLRVYRPWPE